jgi:hypothetical protein
LPNTSRRFFDEQPGGSACSCGTRKRKPSLAQTQKPTRASTLTTSSL